MLQRFRYWLGEKRQETSEEEITKNGIVLSGGFWHGAFQIGALLKISEVGIPIYYVVGSSVGVINGSAIVTGKVKEAVEAWRSITRDQIFRFDAKKFFLEALRNLKSGGLGPDGIFDNSPLLELLHRYGRPEDLINSPIIFDVIVTNLQKKEKEVFSNRDPVVIQDPIRIEKAIIASTSIPIFFEPVVIGDYQYLDGGIVDNAPLSHAIKAGCDTIFFIDVSSPESLSSGFTGSPVKQKVLKHYHGFYSLGLIIAEILTKTSLEYDIRRAEEVNADINNLDAFRTWFINECDSRKKKNKFEGFMNRFSFSRKKRVRVIAIKPTKPLPGVSLRGDVDPKVIEEMIDYGYKLTTKILKKEKII